MSEWLPIDSAPKDGTRVLLLRGKNAVCGRWDDESYSRNPRPYWKHDLSSIFGVRDARQNAPTHWMPLPQPPEVA